MSGWDMMGKAERIQQAAAEAVLAERQRHREIIGRQTSGADDPRMPGVDQEDFEQSVEQGMPYPPDAYDISQVADVPSHFEWLADRDPAPLEGKKQTMYTAGDDLGERLPGEIENLHSLLSMENIGSKGLFTGTTATAFGAFLINSGQASRNLSDVADELVSGVATMEEILNAAEKDMESITEKTVEALNKIRDDSVGSAKQPLLTLAGVAATVIAGAPAGPAGLLWALVGGMVTVARAADYDSEPVGAVRVEEVLNLMAGEIKKRKGTVESKEADVASALTYDTGKAERKRSVLCPDSKEHNMYDGPGNLGLAKGVTTVAMHTIHDHAITTVPGFAKTFAAKASQISGTAGTGSQAMGRASGPWDTLCTIVERYLTETSGRLYKGGDNLAKAMVDFAEQDGANAKWVRKPVTDHAGPEVPDNYWERDPYPWRR